MGTKRTPLRRAMNQRITPEAVAIFKKMHRGECTCAPDAFERCDSVCPRCNRWWDLVDDLAAALGIREPWDYPCIEDPDAKNPYPPTHGNHKWWIQERERNPHRMELWRALVEAAKR